MKYLYWFLMAIVAAVVVMCFVLVALLIASPVHAERYCAHWYGVRVYDVWGNWRVERRCARWIRDEDYHRYNSRPERVYGYERRQNDPDERGHCQPERITGVSSEHKDIDKARSDAVEQWRKTVSWSGGGGEYMNYDLAIEREFRCGPSSPGDTWLGKVSKFGGRALGAVTPGQGTVNIEGLSQRCQVWARPCRARREVDISEPQR